MLVAAFREEDRLLRQTLTSLSRPTLLQASCNHLPKFKETLGHIAYWDSYLVHYLHCKLNAVSCCLAPPVAFEYLNQLELDRARALSFQEVLTGYREATHALVGFLETHWDDLNEFQRRSMQVPLRHRRHHRIGLDQALDSDVENLADLVASA